MNNRELCPNFMTSPTLQPHAAIKSFSLHFRNMRGFLLIGGSQECSLRHSNVLNIVTILLLPERCVDLGFEPALIEPCAVHAARVVQQRSPVHSNHSTIQRQRLLMEGHR